ncbi:MAG: hypothetical protein IT158_18355 [Bryobacterales bacterium]|nr:hypothetical protein [Bryobacterales bacterium]
MDPEVVEAELRRALESAEAEYRTAQEEAERLLALAQEAGAASDAYKAHQAAAEVRKAAGEKYRKALEDFTAFVTSQYPPGDF